VSPAIGTIGLLYEWVYALYAYILLADTVFLATRVAKDISLLRYAHYTKRQWKIHG
jgi:hypothetical protein